MDYFYAIQDWVIAAGGSPWALVAVLVLCILDGFFPPLPSESIVIALAALTVTSDGPNVVLLWAVASIGAFLGDQVAYSIGARIPVKKIPFLNRGTGARAYAKAGSLLLTHGPVFIMAARFVPIGRIAVNMGAGATGYRRSTFSIVDSISAMLWAAYSVAVGVGAAHVLEGHPLLSMALGIVSGVILGYLISHLITVSQKKFFPARYVEAERAAQEWAHDHIEGGADSPGTSHL